MPQPQANSARILWDLRSGLTDTRFEDYWKDRNTGYIPKDLFSHPRVSLEIGAGTGAFFTELAARFPDRFFIPVERCRMRAKRLLRKTSRSGLPNLVGFRGNAIPPLVHGIPSQSVERIYILYPCPWLKTSQRKHRWYLHPILPHFARVLKPGGLLIWASDQEFYIDEARLVCEQKLGLKVLVHGEVSPNPYNEMEAYPQGRTKFERTFLAQGQPCYEVILQT